MAVSAMGEMMIVAIVVVVVVAGFVFELEHLAVGNDTASFVVDRTRPLLAVVRR